MSPSPSSEPSEHPFSPPPGFLWGASTAAHQIEGQNTNSDWWHKEHAEGTHVQEPSADAADSYHRWPEDMDLLAELGFTDYRFSIEWARIEPAQGEFSRAQLAHYRRMVEGALARGLRPMVTLHHFTVPQWFAERGGWTAHGAVDLFARYVEATAPVIAADVAHVCTINEPNMVAVMGAVEQLGVDALGPAGLPLPDKDTSVALIEAHGLAREVIRSLSPAVKVGWSVANQVYQALPGAERTTADYSWPREDVFLEASRDDDWVGVQSYTRTQVGPDGPVPAPDDAERTLSGWEYYPPALGEAVRHTARVATGVPIIVTENGISTADDSRRVDYTAGALTGLAEAMADGIDVRGYFHWSALDNYEWGSYRPTFGLIAVDPVTFARTPKESGRWLGAMGRRARIGRT
ncbi:beta-glucosidase [Streptomyces violarus]|uniref:Beta-glucosidase n=1 Tax=Streptomyces violarus TaxID=67380 RepID=A0A7W5F009_9ACTN|nr:MULTISPECIES: family 1 glycosylhydrolase [Streptomyces]MBB3074868.1 beta-glucosidase [Streptomyces violarus]WRT97517.1 family 1 glycosylhydrolase [Streptomyces sp. CGMCC 4.1772]GHD01156.1 beta-glucosidase [Streptomyces violarus]